MNSNYFAKNLFFLCCLLIGAINFSACEDAPELEMEAPPKHHGPTKLECLNTMPDHAEGYPDPYAALGKGDWEFKGPYDWGSRIISIAMDPQNPYRLYAGSASGGLWLNENTQNPSWQYVKVGDFPVMGVGAIAIHPTNSDILYIGTGEVYNYENSTGGYDVHKTRGSYGIGILYSVDRGANWELLSGLPDKQTLGVQDIEIVAHDDTYTVWAATTEGVYKSVGGAPLELSLKRQMAIDVSVHPSDPNQVVAAVGNLNTPNAGLYTYDAEKKEWNNNHPREAYEFMGKAELARSPSNPNVVYAVMGTWNPLYFYNNLKDKKGECVWPDSGAPKTAHNWIHLSKDGGKSWELKYDGKKFSGGQGHYSLAITVNPLNENHLWLGGIAPTRVSYDAGASVLYAPTSGGTSGLNNGCLVEAMGNFDVHQILFASRDSNLIYICSDQGVYMSSDGGKTVNRINQNLAIMQFYPHMAVSQKDPNIMFGCAQDYGPGCLTYMGHNDTINRSQWKMLYGYGHEAGASAYDAKNDIAFMTIHMGSMIARTHLDPNAPIIDEPDTSSSSGNGARNFIPDLNPFNRSEFCWENTSWNAPIAFSENNPNILYAAKDIVYKSNKQKDGKAPGIVWEPTNPTGEGLDKNPIHQMVVSPKSENNIYIATAPRYGEMHVYTTSNGGVDWLNISSGKLPKNRIPSSLTLDVSDEKTLYITFDNFAEGRVWKGVKTDDDWNWTAIDKGLPKTFTRGFALDSFTPGRLFVATDLGVYESTDYGQNWTKYSDGLPAAIEGVQLIVFEKQRLLRLVSHGNGVWERKI